MGAGKTTVGQLLARKLNRVFIDTDEAIEQEYGMPVSHIFKEYGELEFRNKEKSLITDLCQKKNLVLSLGGGAFLQEEIRNVCLTKSVVIYLDISFTNWKDRMALLMDTRPILQNKTLQEMEELYNSRQAIYAHHHIKINVNGKGPEEIADFIIDKLPLKQN
ncbi:shikimate kinase [Neobacillus dielmonensis]|uniref:shikimate kinase n=1 Tax=Neobacillus dielmonensis TaxID=1347369 RepID=UPI0005A85EEB|nr:shikimate kinase [Neobacillus dielmonensis]